MDCVTDLKTTVTPLHGRLAHCWEAEPSVARVTYDLSEGGRADHCLITTDRDDNFPAIARLSFDGGHQVHPLPSELSHLSEGNIIRINPRRGEVWVMYRRQSRFNSMLLTERCNSWCVMCSQPPKAGNDDFLSDAWAAAIPLMSPETRELGITGGEQYFGLEEYLQIELRSLCCSK